MGRSRHAGQYKSVTDGLVRFSCYRRRSYMIVVCADNMCFFTNFPARHHYSVVVNSSHLENDISLFRISYHLFPSLLFRWAYPLLGLPFILLMNDALHFIPEDGPLSYLLRF